jgi:hypothetical protein
VNTGDYCLSIREKESQRKFFEGLETILNNQPVNASSWSVEYE